jgi:signal transduction histidine kinase
MKRLIPDSIAARIMLVLVLGLGLSHAVSVGLYITDRSVALVARDGAHLGERVAVIDRLMRLSPAQGREQLLSLANSPRLHITQTSDSAVAKTEKPSRSAAVFRNALAAHLTPDDSRQIHLKSLGVIAPSNLHPDDPQAPVGGDQSEAMLVSLSQPDGSWLNFTVLVNKPESFWSIRLTLSIAVMLGAALILAVLVVSNLTRPLATFAMAAQRLGRDMRAPPLPEGGPTEIRRASIAFNRMQTRLRRFIEDRTQMIAAISHDLATPIARMRLRAEYVEDPEQRQKMLADLDDMERMVFATLAFARNEADNEPSTRVDLRILLERICNDAIDAGQDVTLRTQDDAVPFTCRPTALRRALGNLIDNAVKYGNRAEVSCEQQDKHICITIVDDGPGIPPERQEDVFKPFHRLEQSRNRETGGTGLGMTIARTIVRAHGGDIKLINTEKRGLCLQVTLPRESIFRNG